MEKLPCALHVLFMCKINIIKLDVLYKRNKNEKNAETALTNGCAKCIVLNMKAVSKCKTNKEGGIFHGKGKRKGG